MATDAFFAAGKRAGHLGTSGKSADNGTVARLSRRTERIDALNVMAADRRELALQIRTDRPLRKPRGRAQQRSIAAMREQAESQIRDQMSAPARRAFRGHIAVELRAAVDDGRGVPDLATMVKEYMDLLKGLVVPDDSVVDHLIAVREPGASPGAEVTIRCQPLAIFEANYDRAFRMLDSGAVYQTVTPERSREPAAPFLNAGTNPNWRWGLSGFGEIDQVELRRDERLLDELLAANDLEDEALAEDEDAFVDLDLPSMYDGEFDRRDVRDDMIDQLVAKIAAARGAWLVDQGFDARDRPGPFPAWVLELIERDEADIELLRDAGPGCFMLSAPPARPPGSSAKRWNEDVVLKFATVLRHGRWSDPTFRDEIALDIALRGEAGQDNDIDNVARRIIKAFFVACGNDDVPNLGAYRVYRKPWPDNDVRVRLMPKIRLEALARSMDRARREASTAPDR